jgi:2-polyprenyl-3-methyl-5-hydroxy-6-metoxy-1,4-benzoquinol methylase
MNLDNPVEANDQAREVWNANAAFWDSRMGEGNHFVKVLTWPATERLLKLQPGEHVLDVACGNGQTSRRMASLGAQVLGIDIAAGMLVHARRYPTPPDGSIDYQELDATDEKSLLQLGEHRFDAALCEMALFDMAQIEPLFRALSHLLRPGGRFVFSVVHPCFNQLRAVPMAEMDETDGRVVTTYAVKVKGYMTPFTAYTIAMHNQPRVQPSFHRPLQVLLGAGFQAGFVMDALEERAFPPDHPDGTLPLSWGGKFSEIPPVLVVRMIKPGSTAPAGQR